VLVAQRAATEALERESSKIIPWVFHRDGKPIHFFRRSWITACKAAGCPGRIPHDFRRTAVRNLERAGVPRSVAMKITGHKTESVYRRYAIVSEADLRSGVEKLALLGTGTIAGTVALPGVVVPMKTAKKSRKSGGRGQNRTVDTTIFSHS
jgi:integrase